MFNLFQHQPRKLPFTFYPHTPDVAEIEESEFQLLFICDSMMTNRSDYSKIKEHSTFRVKAFSQQSFRYYKQTLPGQPSLAIPLPPDDGLFKKGFIPNAKIYGELHRVQSTFIKELDIIKDNRVQFQRQRVKILIPGRWRQNEENRDVNGKRLPLVLQGKRNAISPEQLHLRKAWMYVAIPDYWNNLLDGGYFFSGVVTKKPYRSKQWLGEQFYYYE